MSSARKRNLLSTAISRLALLLGLADVGAWTYITFHGGNECQYFFDNPILLFAFFLLITWLLKFISCKYFSSRSWIRTMSTTVTLALILAVFSSMTLALIVTNTGKGEVIPGRHWRNMYLMFKPTTWFQKYVLESMYQHGDHPAKCVSGICQAFAGLNLSALEFRKIERRLSPLELGCCTPPPYCCMEYKNATFWEKTQFFPFECRDQEAGMLEECSKWKNGHTTLCYSCGICMVRIVENVVKVWRHLALLNICVLILTVILYCNDCRKKYKVSIKFESESSSNI